MEYYTAIVFLSDGRPRKYYNVVDVDKLFKAVAADKKTPLYANLYQKKQYVKRVYKQ